MKQTSATIKAYWIWIVLLGVLFTVLNWQIPRVIDDYPYSRSFVGLESIEDDQNMSATLNSLGDLIESQVTHYQVVNGRALVHSIVQVFCCWLGQIPFDILQGVLFALCLILLAKHVGSKNILAGIPVMLIFMLLFREPSCIYHGVACGVNYLWVMALVLGFRWMYLKEKTIPILLGIMAFVTGFSNEAFAIPFTGAFFLEVLLQWKKHTPPQRIAVAVMCVGTLLLIIAPANFHRLAITEQTESASSLPLHLQPVLNLRLTLLCFVSGLVTWFTKNRNFIKENLFWICAIVLSVLMSLTIGGENIRQCIAAELCSAILIVKIGREWLHHGLHKPLLAASAIMLSAVFLGINLIQRPMTERFEEVRNEVEKSTEKNIIIRTKDIFLTPQIEKYRCCELSDFQLEQFRWWYGKESVAVVYSDFSRTK